MNLSQQRIASKHGRFFIVALLCCLVQGCKSKPAISPGNDPSTAANSQPLDSAPLPDPATLGSATGTVHLTGKPPAPVKIDTSMDPACGLGGAPDFNSEQYVVQDSKLANVYIYVKSGPPAAASVPSTIPVVLDQKGCRYTPHVIAVQQGGSVSFQNSDVTMHNIHTMPASVGSGNEAIDISQGPKGAPIVKQFKNAEAMLPVRCNNHPWMNAFINVSATPFFAVTDVAGHFDLRGLPAGDYVLGAVHEKLGEQTLKVTVAAKSPAKADFTFTIK